VDALKGLRHDAGLSISQNGCPMPGVMDPLFNQVFGDWDCNGVVNPVDALKDLRYDAGLEVAQDEPCPEIGVLYMAAGGPNTRWAPPEGNSGDKRSDGRRLPGI
jgi:hypothetical protein